MSKVSSKLASGVRKVKAQQPEASTAQPAPAASAAQAPRPRAKKSGSALHPARVWPD